MEGEKKHIDSYIPDRLEFKYVLGPLKAVHVHDYLVSLGLTADSYSKSGPYTVNSLYFDTPFFDDYRDKDASLLRRKKLRARIYNAHWDDDFDRVWLEVKHKNNMNIWKDRTAIDRSTWDSFIHDGGLSLIGNVKSTDSSALSSFSYHYLRERYRPHAVVKYERRAYLDNFLSSVRVTFDTRVRVSRALDYNSEKLMTPVTHGLTVLEIKFNHRMPWWFTKAVRMFELRRTDFSKYRNSVAVLRGVSRVPIAK